MSRKLALLVAAYLTVGSLALRAQQVTVDPGCEPYTNSDTAHHQVLLPANTSASVSFTRGTDQEKSNLHILEQLPDGTWSEIWEHADIPKTPWPIANPAMDIKAQPKDRGFTATAEASNPGNGNPYVMTFGQYCVDIDSGTNTVTRVHLILSPHPETELKNTIVYFAFTPAIPIDKYKAAGKQ